MITTKQQWLLQLQSPQLICVICLNINQEFYVEGSCCSIVCIPCRQQINKKCPVCQRSDPKYRYPSVIEKMYFNSLDILCPCSSIMQLQTIDSHWEQCQLRHIKCQYCFQFVAYPFIDDHISKCPFNIVQCDKCNKYIKNQYLEYHNINNCQYGQTQCYYCNQSITRYLLNDHMTNECIVLNNTCNLCQTVYQLDLDHDSVCPMYQYTCQQCLCSDYRKNKQTHNCVNALKDKVQTLQNQITEQTNKNNIRTLSGYILTEQELIENINNNQYYVFQHSDVQYYCESCYYKCNKNCKRKGNHYIIYKGQNVVKILYDNQTILKLFFNNILVFEHSDDIKILNVLNDNELINKQ